MGWFSSRKRLDSVVRRKHCGKEFLAEFQDSINRLNPDVIITKGGDALHFAALDKLAKRVGFDLNLSRAESELKPRSMSRVVHSYGQVIRKDAYFP